MDLRKVESGIHHESREITGCGTCEEVCPVEAIKVENEKAVVDKETCVDCWDLY